MSVRVFADTSNQYVRSRNRGPAVGTVEEWRAMIKAMIDIVLKLVLCTSTPLTSGKEGVSSR